MLNLLCFSGGWNNSPTAIQFEYIFRHLLVRCGVLPSKTGNATQQDDTMSLSLMDTSCVVGRISENDEPGPSPFADVAGLLLDHDYMGGQFSGLIANAITYISGWVVKKAVKQVSCDICRESLVSQYDIQSSTDDTSYHLLVLKNRGGLTIPSIGVIKVVKAAERCIRQAGLMVPQWNKLHRLPLLHVDRVVRAEIGTEDIFELGEHISESQHGISNHHFSLISLIVSTFFHMRQHHVAKLETLKIQTGNLRKKLGKTILFSGH